MTDLLTNAYVQTAIGGLQKEAYFAGVPALMMMPGTAWMELVEAGWNLLVDANKELIIDKAFIHEPPANAPENLYGDGRAEEKIARIVSL